MANISVADLMEAGVHFGHQTKRWNPKMKKFIFAERNGIHIFDLNKTLTQLQVACGFLHEVVLNNGQVLFVGTKKQAQQELKDAAQSVGQPYVVDRWLGGTLTNLRTIRNSVKRMQQVDRLLQQAESGGPINKKEQAFLKREQYKLHRNLDGIVAMERPPGALFVVDILREQIAVHEARRLNIPIVAIVDTNCDPDLVTYPIAGNDDAIRAVKCITGVIVETIREAQAHLGVTIPAPAAEPAPVAEPAPTAPATEPQSTAAS